MKALIVADLHYNLRQFDWLLQAAADYDLVILAGDLLDLAGHADLDTQIVVVTKYLARIARRLGLAPRSLQRALARVGTSFRAEVEDARFALACRLLLETDAKLEVIARRIGLGPAQLTTLFRRRLGTTPSAWRATRRDEG